MIPRLVIAGTGSGAGKTSVSCGVIRALGRRGLRVQAFKVGPDYIDSSYHALASGRPGRNLDAFLSGPELIAPLFRHGAHGADVAVVEGVMGLFDGASGRGELASTAHVAKLLRAPVVLVVDAGAMARSVAAIVHGYHTFDPELDVAAVILNRVGSDHHAQLLREALEPLGVPVLGALRRDRTVRAPERHLGLVPAAEREADARACLDALTAAVERHVDVEGLAALARSAPKLGGPRWSPDPPGAGTSARTDAGTRAGGGRIALARGRAFSFHYPENLELLAAAGAELLDFDPLSDERLPERTGALLLAGGFPELFCGELEENVALRRAVAAFAAAGRPILAECGGLLFLCRELDGRQMCGVLDARARMSERLTLGYREATAAAATAWLAPGTRVRGHEFHYTQVHSAEPQSAWMLNARGRAWPEGITARGVQASYLHVHWAAHPQIAWRFAEAARVTPGVEAAWA
jgi:cobyrinic acid a,c-diamide synthase